MPLVLLPATTNAAGFAAWGMFIPPQLGLRGSTIAAQAIVLDATNAASLVTTSGLRCTIGD